NLAILLGAAYDCFLDSDHAFSARVEALEQLPATEASLRRHLEAALLFPATWIMPGRDDILGRVPALR
ncbi:hypothetical protein, partial [Streptomyces sp. SID5770]|uniref:hypothetical protein n=1 Tax=Streptomyces sp. SID5770 TaxID=2690308 RepID=UPI001F177E2E